MIRTLPPYARLLGLEAETGADGAPVLVMPFADAVLGRPGFLHGGAIGGLMEMAAFVALDQALGSGERRVKPINLTVDFMRGGRDHPTRASGRVLRLGNRVANVEAVAWQEDRDQPIATARVNFRILRAEG